MMRRQYLSPSQPTTPRHLSSADMLTAPVFTTKLVFNTARPYSNSHAPRLPRRPLKATPAEGRRASQRPTAILSEKLADVGGGDIPGGTFLRPVGEDDGGNFFEYNALLDALVKGGVALSELPRDLQEAMSLGLMSMKDVYLWLNISAVPFLGGICRAAPAIRDRIMGNPRFLMQLCVELALGLSAKTAAEIKARGKKCFKEELPFFVSDLMLEACADVALVWLLSPKRSFKALPTHPVARAIARLPGHAMQSGGYSLSQRAMTMIYRSCQFFIVGMMTSIVGHSVTKWAVENKPGPKDDVHLAPVLDNSVGFGAFMALSSNLRYQTVNGLEDRLLDAFLPSSGLNAIATLALRFANCYYGSVQWVWFAKATGLQ